MNSLINITEKNGIPVVTSREISQNFEKEHRVVLKAIDDLVSEMGVAQNYAGLFIPSEYQHEQNKQTYREYLLTRDGFSLLVMGFTGSKALEWKLKYIEAFNKMEQALKAPTCLEDVLIASLQEMKEVKNQLAAVKEASQQTKQEIQGIRDVVALNPVQWRKDTTDLINKMALKLGGYEHIRAIREASYKLLDTRFAVDIKTRLTNKRRRMADEGVCKSKRDKLNPLDVIADDKKLVEGYIAIIKEMSIKYGVA